MIADGIEISSLKAPFPAFGGKSRIAAEVWSRFGVGEDAARNYIEPFAFSAAMLLKRPGGAGAVETINDLNCYVANFWRAVKSDPDQVAHHADWPVNETDLHARHKWLVKSDAASAALAKVREDPEFFDAKIAGWWCWGACCWIGSGWCDETHRNGDGLQRVFITSDGKGNGINRMPSEQLPHMDAAGRLILSGPSEQLPRLTGCNGVHGANGIDLDDPPQRMNLEHACGVTRDLCQKHANIGNSKGVVRPPESAEPKIGRVQLADEFARGRGVHGNDRLGTCDARSKWIRDWMYSLADRLRPVRVCCGHWSRICDSPSTMTRLGTTNVFLDPPYRKNIVCGATGKSRKNRTGHIYSNDRTQDVNMLCDEVEAWCLKWGPDPLVRIALCGLEGEYPKVEKAGWTVFAWKSVGGYGNQSGSKSENAARERVWFSPHCLSGAAPAQMEMFAGGGV